MMAKRSPEKVVLLAMTWPCTLTPLSDTVPLIVVSAFADPAIPRKLKNNDPPIEEPFKTNDAWPSPLTAEPTRPSRRPNSAPIIRT
jgi:hypothetical protein